MHSDPPLAVSMLLHRPAFLAGLLEAAAIPCASGGHVTAVLTTPGGSWREELGPVAEWPREVVLYLHADTVLLLSLFLTPEGMPQLAGQARHLATVCAPMWCVIEQETSVSFCTLWLGLEASQEPVRLATSFDTNIVAEEAERGFSRAVESGRELTQPKVGITFKVAEQEALEVDRLSMFSVVDIYAAELAGLYSRAEAAFLRERSAEAAAAQDCLEAEVRKRQQHVEALKVELQSLALARREALRRASRSQEETVRLWRGASLGRLAAGEQQAAASGSAAAVLQVAAGPTAEVLGYACTTAIKRAERVAEQERLRARALQQELDATRQRLATVLAERQEELGTPRLAAAGATARSLSRQTPRTGPVAEVEGPASSREQEKTILKLRREVGALVKTRSEQRRHLALMEQRLGEAQQQCLELERRLGDAQAADVAVPPEGVESQEARCPSRAEAQLQWRLHEENVRLHEKLVHSRSELRRARADVAPLRDEKCRLSAELSALLRSRASGAEELRARLAPQRPERREPQARSLGAVSGRRGAGAGEAEVPASRRPPSSRGPSRPSRAAFCRSPGSSRSRLRTAEAASSEGDASPAALVP